MNRRVLFLDSGQDDLAAHDALDRAWLAAHARGRSPGMLRLWSAPPSAWVGRHQAVDREVRLDFCEQAGISVVSRATGGPAVYLDDGQLGFSLVFPLGREGGASLAQIHAAVAEGLARALDLGESPIGFGHPDRILVGDAILGRVFALRQGPSVLVQGSLLLEADPRRTLEVLRAPSHKVNAEGIEDLRHELITVAQALGRHRAPADLPSRLAAGLAEVLGLAPEPAGSDLPVDAPAGDPGADWREGRDRLVEAFWRTPACTLRVRIALGRDGASYETVALAGDAHVHPPGLFGALAERLAGQPVADTGRMVRAALAEPGVELTGFNGQDILRVLGLALEKESLTRKGELSVAEANALMPYRNALSADVLDTVRDARMVLVPYCAKPVWCAWRERDGCGDCGMCPLAEIHRVAADRGLTVHTVGSHEHLADTLAEMRDAGVPAFMGLCCNEFFHRSQAAIESAGVPAVVVDIKGSNCYQPRTGPGGYENEFRARSEPDTALFRKVLKLVEMPAEKREAAPSGPQPEPKDRS